MLSERLENHPSCRSSEIASRQESETQLLISILVSSLLSGFLTLHIHHQDVEGNFSPAFIFAAHPFSFSALVIAVMVSFAGAFSGLLIGINSRLATIRRFYFRISVVSMASTLLILTCALFLEIFRLLVSSGFRLSQPNEDGTDSLFDYKNLFQGGFFRFQIVEEGANSFFVYDYVCQVFRKTCPGSENPLTIT